MNNVVLKPGREKSLKRRHPWVFTGAIARVEGLPASGETVAIRAADGTPLGLGAWSPQSQIAVRVWTFDPRADVSAGFFHSRLERAIAARTPLVSRDDSTALRLVNAESDGLPGLIVDRYGAYLVCQFLAAGAERWKREIVAALEQLAPAIGSAAIAGIYERSDVDVRAKEGLPPTTGVLSGSPPPELLEIREGPCRFLVDVARGHKTGFYLDQRDNRACVAEYARDAEVLNCFSYSGGFAIRGLLAGAAHATNIDSSAAALELARRNAELNGIETARMDNVEGDVFEVLRAYRNAGRQFDLIVLDPPKFAESRHQLPRASRGYKDINLLAFKLLRPGGWLFTFSCSGLMTRELFEKIVADAALDAAAAGGRDAQIVRRLGQAADHPTALSFPEGSYLKGLVCRAGA